MRFDDRLTTVLAQPAGDPHDRAVRWRQLVDLLARAGQSESERLDEALVEVRSEASHVDGAVRAAAARSIAALPLPVGLVAVFAADTLPVAAPVLGSASLDSGEWRRVHDAASADCRRFIAALHPELSERERAAPSPAAHQGKDEAIPSIGEVVARIERLRESREQEAAPPVAPRAPPNQPGQALFRWECNPSGEFAWVDGVPRGALIGRSLAHASGDEGVDPSVARAFALRAPFHDGTLLLAGEGAAAGEWKISGMPAFEPADGRFAGYRGVATRGGSEGMSVKTAIPADHDTIRELVHELKTPLNAIIGFAEIIDGQYLGPADHRYRARAAEIVAQARLLVAAIDDLDLAARLQSGREPASEPVRLDQLMTHLGPELLQRASDRGAVLELGECGEGASCAIHPGIAEQLVRRFCEAVIDLAGQGETLVMRPQILRDRCSLSVALPRALRGADADELLAGAPASRNGEEPDPFFWLRLVRGLARLTDGEMMVVDGTLSLILPKARS